MAGRTLYQGVQWYGGLGAAPSHQGGGAGRALCRRRFHGLPIVPALASATDQTGPLLECLHPQAAVCLGRRGTTAQADGAPSSAKGGPLAVYSEGGSYTARG